MKKNNIIRIIIYGILLLMCLILSIIGIGSKYKGYGKKDDIEYLSNLKIEFDNYNTDNSISMNIKNNNVIVNYNEEIYEFKYEDSILYTSYDSNYLYSSNVAQLMESLVSALLGNNYQSTYDIFQNIVLQDMIKEYGFEFIYGDENTILKINTLSSINDIFSGYSPIYALDLDSDKSKIISNSTYTFKKGNISALISHSGDSVYIISIKETPLLTTNTYNSIVAFLNIIFDSSVSTHFQSIYPKILKNNYDTDGITIEYTPEKNDNEKQLLGNGKYEFIRLTINQSKIVIK